MMISSPGPGRQGSRARRSRGRLRTRGGLSQRGGRRRRLRGGGRRVGGLGRGLQFRLDPAPQLRLHAAVGNRYENVRIRAQRGAIRRRAVRLAPVGVGQVDQFGDFASGEAKQIWNPDRLPARSNHFCPPFPIGRHSFWRDFTAKDILVEIDVKRHSIRQKCHFRDELEHTIQEQIFQTVHRKEVARRPSSVFLGKGAMPLQGSNSGWKGKLARHTENKPDPIVLRIERKIPKILGLTDLGNVGKLPRNIQPVPEITRIDWWKVEFRQLALKICIDPELPAPSP